MYILWWYNGVLRDLNLLLTNRGKKARKGEKQKGGKKGQGSEGGPTSPTEEKAGEDFIPPPTQVHEVISDM